MTIHYISPDLSFKGSNRSKKKFTSFHKTELNLILSVYAQKVSQGHWKDYAIDHGKYNAVFSIYRSTFENAFLRIIKNKNRKCSMKKAFDVRFLLFHRANFIIIFVN